MTDSNDVARVAEIAARWKREKQWIMHKSKGDDDYCVIVSGTMEAFRGGYMYEPVCEKIDTKRRAVTIAAAPTDIAYLLARVRTLEAEIHNAAIDYSHLEEKFEEEIRILRNQIK